MGGRAGSRGIGIVGRDGMEREGIGMERDGRVMFKLIWNPKSGIWKLGSLGSGIDGRLGILREGIGIESEGS